MARAALEWSLEDAAKAAGVSRRTVLRFERYHSDVKPELIEALRRGYEAAEVRFLDEGPDRAPSSRLRCVSRDESYDGRSERGLCIEVWRFGEGGVDGPDQRDVIST